MARDIVIWPHKVLTSPTQPVTDFGPALETLLQEMSESMAEAKGIGIAANQVGVALRVAIVGREDGTQFEIVNPQMLSKEGSVKYEEGCLSVPDVWEKCPRVERVKVRYQDKTGEWHELEADGRLAHVLQHEIDHLDGHVFVEHLGSLKQKLIKERMLKLQKSLARRKDEPSQDKGTKRS
ncbi:peptide deformylase [Corallococcus interemptor]|uniref:peptide deformylase n=1 Tax=Corallococcus interemptor TaxID=2316720 RepID=UPI003D00A57A